MFAYLKGTTEQLTHENRPEHPSQYKGIIKVAANRVILAHLETGQFRALRLIPRLTYT